MSKAILVMDMPDSCLDCRFCREIDEGTEACCEIMDEPNDSSLCRMIEDYCQCRPNWCPLKIHHLKKKVVIVLINLKTDMRKVGMIVLKKFLNK